MRKLLPLTLLAALALAPMVRAAPVTDTEAQAALTSKSRLACIGHGAPAVVFLYDAGAERSTWDKVAAGAANLSRACFYKRSPRRETVTSVTSDLHAELRRAGIKGPVVLAGHGIGAFYAIFYTDRYWRDVSGLVLIDPVYSREQADEETKRAHPFGDMPMTVLTASERDFPTVIDQAERTGIFDALKASNAELAARSVRGVSDVVPGAHHAIQRDHPQAVLDAIADVVGRARARREP